MKPQAPARVKDITEYWNRGPELLSDRCEWWIARINGGWRPNSRLRSWGYFESAEYYGVYLWEWFNALYPLLRSLR